MLRMDPYDWQTCPPKIFVPIANDGKISKLFPAKNIVMIEENVSAATYFTMGSTCQTKLR